MNPVFLLSIILIKSCVVLGQQPSIFCNYIFTVANEYTCNMRIFNPNGLNNFTEINGTHLANMTSSDVQNIIFSGSEGNTLNFPSIICNTFSNAHTIDFQRADIQRIDEDSFKSCTKLSRLILSHNRIDSLDEKSFIDNRNLTNLEFWNNQLTVVPENTFINQHQLTHLSFSANNITDFADETFKSLRNLKALFVSTNRITRLKHKWFETLENLEGLFIYENQISDLPEGIFTPLKNMWLLSASSMNLKAVHSSSFGSLPKLNSIDFSVNQIDAFDERVIDNTSVGTLDMTNNICANEWMQDHSPSRYILRATMKDCFENYRNLLNETTTTPPPGCIVGNLDNRVCRLEDQFGEFDENFQNENSRLNSVTEELRSEIEVLRQEKLELQQNMTAAIEVLQKQINDLANKTCGCR